MISNNNWTKMIFENRNQSYGAYELRLSFVGFQSKALIISVIFFIFLMIVLFGLQQIVLDQAIEKVFVLPKAMLKDKNKPQPQLEKQQIEAQQEQQTISVELPLVANWVIHEDKDFYDYVVEKHAGRVLEEGVLKYAIDPKTGKDFVPEKAGSYKGGYDKLYEHILNHITFKANPNEVNPHDDGSDEIDYEINTMIWIQCDLNADGTLANVSIFKGATDPKFNDRVLEAVKSSPDWIAAQHKGKKIKQTMIIPFHFNYMQPQFKYYNYL